MTQNLSIIICINRRFDMTKPSCAGSGSEAMADELDRLLADSGLEIEVKRVKCISHSDISHHNLDVHQGLRLVSWDKLI